MKREESTTHTLVVLLYDDRAWMLPQQLFPYAAYKDKFTKSSCKRKGYNEGIWEIEEDPDLTVCKLSHLINLKPKRTKKPRAKSNEVSYIIIQL